ncbi:MAG: hypothetical protein OXR73_39145, partial [Myxococcales bacterium]|nr:hypothetical protein [Myxococcales bacterium]
PLRRPQSGGTNPSEPACWRLGFALDVGYATSCVLAGIDDRLLCWGDNSYGQLGIGDTGSHVGAVQVVFP